MGDKGDGGGVKYLKKCVTPFMDVSKQKVFFKL